jgi:hypothetical protein
MSFKEIIEKSENNLKVYKNPFATYQDMIDAGHFIMEYSDQDEDDVDIDDDTDSDYESLPELIDIEPNKLDDCFKSVEEEEEKEEKEESDYDEVMSELSEEDLNTISVIEEVFKYSKKISNSNKALKKEVEELRDVVNDMGIFIKFSIIFFGFVLVFCQENVCKRVNHIYLS